MQSGRTPWPPRDDGGRRGLNIVKGWQNLFWIGFATQTLANTYMKLGLGSQTDAAVLDTIDWRLAIGQVWETLGILWSTVVNFLGLVEVGLSAQILSMVYHHPEAIPFTGKQLNKRDPSLKRIWGQMLSRPPGRRE